MVANVMLYDFPDNSFDIIYSRDCIQHIDDIDTLYKRLYVGLSIDRLTLISINNNTEMAASRRSFVDNAVHSW